VAEALISGGAALDVPGGSIGTPLENAVGYGCWHVARLLVAPGYAEQTAAQAAAALDTRRENVVSWLSERQGDGNSPG